VYILSPRRHLPFFYPCHAASPLPTSIDSHIVIEARPYLLQGIGISQAANIPPLTRKRKAAEATITSTPKEDVANKKILVSAASALAAPPTPVTTTTSVEMDSEEDFMSQMSSDDENMNYDSGDALSDADGMNNPNPIQAPLEAYHLMLIST
jgi:hypothetical protein